MELNTAILKMINYEAHSDFSLNNLPYGIYATRDKSKRVGVAIGAGILDLAMIYRLDLIPGIQKKISANVFEEQTLNSFIGLGKDAWSFVRKGLISLCSTPAALDPAHFLTIIDFQIDATMYLPLDIKNYTDFYSSEAHATNVGRLFRPQADPLLPNWKHLPVAYHGRASSIVISGKDIIRPQGQYLVDHRPVFGPTQELDFELELGYIIGRENELGCSISIDQAQDYLFGVVLLNDWSARDIQRWEYQPLGPFLGKNFATSISPWIVTMEALQPFQSGRSDTQFPQVLDYLDDPDPVFMDILLEVAIEAKTIPRTTLSKSNSKYLYWTIAQQIAHHTINGCNLQIGDVLATGTISGPDHGTLGSLLEITSNGKNPMQLGLAQRTYLSDEDQIIITGYAEKDGIIIGFGELKNKIVSRTSIQPL